MPNRSFSLYPLGLGAGDNGTISLPPIQSITPNPVPAGPGQQVLVIRGAGMVDGDNLAISPVDYGAITNPTTQGYGGPLYAVSGDGTTAKALVDLRGNVAQWTAQIISPYDNHQSPEFHFETVAGAVGPVNQNDYALQSGQLAPVFVLADTQLVPSQDAAGRSTNHVVVTGGSAEVPQPGGGTMHQTFPGPGLLVDQSGTWKFYPASQAKSLVTQRFGDIVPQCIGSAVGQDLVDPFGLPIVTPECPGSLSWVDLNGNAITSPWSTGAVPQPGSPIVTTRPSSTVPYTAPPPVLYASPTSPPPAPGNTPSTLPAAPVPITPLYTDAATVPGSASPGGSGGSGPLYQSPMTNAPTTQGDNSNGIPQPQPTNDGWAILVGLAVVGGIGLYAGRKQKRRTF